MSDRADALIVVLDKTMRTDDAECILKAIEQLRGVLSVSFHIGDISDHIAQQRAKDDLGRKLLAVVYPEIYGDATKP